MHWLFFAILSPAMFAANNLGEKFILDKKIKNPIIIIILAGITSMTVGFCVLIFKGFAISIVDLLLLIFSGTLMIFYLIPYFKALALEDTSRIIPLFQFINIFVLIMAYVFLKETLTGIEFMGFIIIMTGGFMLGARHIEKGILKPRKSMYFMIISSFIYAVCIIVFKLAVSHNNFWVSFGYENIGIGLGAILLFIWKPYRLLFIRESKQINFNLWGLIFSNNLLSVIAEFSGFYAVSLAPVALVTVIGGSQSFFVLLYALILTIWFPKIIKEEIGKNTLIIKISAIIIMFAGIYLISL